jgi:hypothetical protein
MQDLISDGRGQFGPREARRKYGERRVRPHRNGSLIRAHVIPNCSIPLPQPSPGEDVTLRASVGTLGDGFIEAIAHDTIKLISMLQPPNMRGLVVNVPALVDCSVSFPALLRRGISHCENTIWPAYSL